MCGNKGFEENIASSALTRIGIFNHKLNLTSKNKEAFAASTETCIELSTLVNYKEYKYFIKRRTIYSDI